MTDGPGADRVGRSGIFDSVGYLIAQVGMRHRTAAYRVLADVGVHPGQEFLLEHLWLDDGCAQTEIAARAGVEAPTISRMVARLQRAGLVERRPDPDDARVQRVWLTEAGRDAHPDVRRAWRQLEAATLYGLDDRDRDDLRRLLVRVRHNLRPGSTTEPHAPC